MPVPLTLDLMPLLDKDPEQLDALIEHLNASQGIYALDDGKVGLFVNGRLEIPRGASSLFQGILAHPNVQLRFLGPRGRVLPNTNEMTILGQMIRGLTPRLRLVRRIFHDWATVVDGGRLCAAGDEGYDSRTGTLWLGRTLTDPGAVDDSFPHLKRWFSGVWCSESDRTRLLVHAVMIATRSVMSDFPFLVLDGPKKGVGKTRAATAISSFYTGGKHNILTFSAREDKLEFSLGDFAGIPGPNVLVFDNVRGKRGSGHQVRGQIISACANCDHVLVAAKHQGNQPLFSPCLIFTMNRSEVEHDLWDKCVVVRLDGNGQFAYMDPCPREYGLKHRIALMSELHTVLARANYRLPSPPQTRMGDYEGWAQGVAEVLGLELNLDVSTARVDGTEIELRNLLEDIEEHTLAEVTKAIRTRRTLIELNEVLDRAKRATIAGEAKALEAYISLNLADRGLEVVQCPVKNQKVVEIQEVRYD